MWGKTTCLSVIYCMWRRLCGKLHFLGSEGVRSFSDWPHWKTLANQSVQEYQMARYEIWKRKIVSTQKWNEILLRCCIKQNTYIVSVTVFSILFPIMHKSYNISDGKETIWLKVLVCTGLGLGRGNFCSTKTRQSHFRQLWVVKTKPGPFSHKGIIHQWAKRFSIK